MLPTNRFTKMVKNLIVKKKPIICYYFRYYIINKLNFKLAPRGTKDTGSADLRAK